MMDESDDGGAEDEPFVFDPDNLDPDNLRFPAATSYWEAKRSGVRPVRDTSMELFQWSVPWQTYLWGIDPHADLWVQPTVIRTDVVTRNTHRRDGWTNIDVSIPVHFFEGLDREQAQDIYRLIARDTYLWGMEKFGWPEPPPIPGGVPEHAARIPAHDRGLTAPEAGRQIVALLEWEATTQKRPDRLNQRLARDPHWQDYLARVNPIGEFLFTIEVLDQINAVERESWVNPPIEPEDPSDMETTTIHTRIPATLLTGSDTHVEHLYLDIITAIYHWAARQFDWPPPPQTPQPN